MPTEQFIHNGRPLSEWLLQLVDDSPWKRLEAAKVMTEYVYLSKDKWAQMGFEEEGQETPFLGAFRKTICREQFPAATYVQKLLEMSIALEARWLEYLKAPRSEDVSFTTKPAGDQKCSDPSTGAKANLPEGAPRQLNKHEYKRLKREREMLESEPIATGFAILNVINSLGEELIPAKEAMRRMMATHQCNIASGAICRMGKAAMEFYPDLIQGLSTLDSNGYFSKPLGTLLRVVPEKIDEVLSLLSSDVPNVRMNAIYALAHCGRETLSSRPEVEARLLTYVRDCPEGEWYACARAFGSIAVTKDAVVLLLDATRPASGDRAGDAITSLGAMGLEPDRVAPRLIALLDEFHEPDPDWMYYGYHARLAEALGSYLGHIGSAVQVLVKHIWEPTFGEAPIGAKARRRDPDPDQSIIRLLGDLGLAAAEALPALLEMKTELIRREIGERTETTADADYCPDYLLEAIAKIRGEEPSPSS